MRHFGNAIDGLAFVAAVALFAFVTAGRAIGQTPSCEIWTKVTPGPKVQHAAAFDEHRRVLVVFGGDDGFRENGETWEWNGSIWQLRSTGGPLPRERHAMVYDSVRHVTVLFGGSVDGHEFGDTWEWDGQTWTPRSTTGPSARAEHAMAFDSDRGVTVLHGGSPNGQTTWEWNGANWSLRSATGPGPRTNHVMVYDTTRHTTLLHGGSFNADTWEWNGQTGQWSIIPTALLPVRFRACMTYDAERQCAILQGGLNQNNQLEDSTWRFDSISGTWSLIASGPARIESHMVFDPVLGPLMHGGSFGNIAQTAIWRFDQKTLEWSLQGAQSPLTLTGAQLAYDMQAGETILFGGSSFVPNSETWAWDGQKWAIRSSIGPEPRAFHAMCYDPVRERVVLFGGQSSTQALGDTWEWDGSAWLLRSTSGPSPRWNSAMVFDESAGAIVLFSGTTDNLTGMGDTWEWDGTSWTQINSPGPTPRESHGMAYDAFRQRCVVYGGKHYVSNVGNVFYTDIWHRTDSAWSSIALLIPNPGAQRGPAMVFYPPQRSTILIGDGGTPPSGRTWSWNGQQWRQLFNTSSPYSEGNNACYDRNRRKVVFFEKGATWEYGLDPDCPSDVNGDGRVNAEDLLDVISAWGACRGSPCPADVNHDGAVDVADLLIVLANWQFS